MEKITLCGDDCFKCPRYLEKSDEELQRVAQSMLQRSSEYPKRCQKICSQEEYLVLEKAFFNKENNLKK